MDTGPKIKTNGLILYLDAANSKSFRGEPTTNLANTSGGLIDWTIGNLIASVTLTTIESGLTYRITSTTGGAFRIKFDVSKLVNAQTYTMSYKYKIISGGPSFQATDWCDQSIARVTTNMGDYFYETATGSRSTYDSTYRFMGFTISDNTIVEIWDIQLEQKTYATPFTVSERGATVDAGGGLIDLSKNNNNGELVNGPIFNSTNNGSLDFNGTNQWIRLSGFSLSTTSYTKLAWFNPDAATNNIISGGASDGQHAFWMGGTSTNISAGHNGSWGTVTYSPGSLIGKWWMGAVSFSNISGWKLYLNGQLVDTDPSTTTFINGTTARIAAYSEDTYVFNGKISNVQIYNRVLSDSEILQNYNATKSRFGL